MSTDRKLYECRLLTDNDPQLKIKEAENAARGKRLKHEEFLWDGIH